MQLKGRFYTLREIAMIRKRIRKWVKMTHVSTLFADGLRVSTATLTCDKSKTALKTPRILIDTVLYHQQAKRDQRFSGNVQAARNHRTDTLSYQF